MTDVLSLRGSTGPMVHCPQRCCGFAIAVISNSELIC